MHLDKGKDLVLEIPDGSANAAVDLGDIAVSSVRSAPRAIDGKPIVASVTWFAEVAAVFVATFFVASANHPALVSHQHDFAVAGFVTVLTFCLLHRRSRVASSASKGGFRRQMRRAASLSPALLGAAMAGACVLVLLGFALPKLIAPVSLWLATSLVAVTAVGGIAAYVLAHPFVAHRMARKVAVIGHDGNASRVADLCAGRASEPVQFLGIFSDEPARPGGPSVAGSVDELIDLSREMSIDDIVIAVPPDADALETVAQLRWRLRGVAVEVYILPHLAQGEDVVLPVEMFGPLPLVVVQRRPLSHAQALCKRLLDLAFGLILLVLLLPVLVAVAVAVKLDSPGPILFRQPRLGFNDRPFTVLKFRSMHASASDLMASRQTSRRDPRVTRVGRWLRKLSLDELPQLFNVLSGDMSLVGPRPHAPHTRAGGRLLKDAMAEYVIRHQVKPGITGWAQVNGARGELVTMDDLRRRVTFDLEYIQKWSVWLDIRIISMTVLREVFSKHAF